MSTTLVEREREVVAPKEVTEADVLDRAADLLEEFGWTQRSIGMPGNHGGKRLPLCYLGSVAQAAYDFGIRRRTGDGEMQWAAEIIGKNCVDAFFWNDDPRRTKAEVVAALRAAAEKARQS